MNIAVLGAGAVGCYYGGMLARSGQDVVLIGRAPHVEAVQRDGLLLQTSAFTERIGMAASTQSSALRGASLVLCCVKSTDTAAAARAMAPHLDPAALVLSLQNGVDNAQRLRALLPQRVGATVVYVAAEMAGPGHVRHHGRGELIIESAVASAALLQTFTNAGIGCQGSDDVVGELWAKLVINCAYNALSAITQQAYGRLWRSPGIVTVMRAVVDECQAVAQHAGVTLPPDLWTAVEAISGSMRNQVSSTAQDLARHHPTEIDHLNGHIVLLGARLGVPTPVNQALTAIVKQLEGP